MNPAAALSAKIPPGAEVPRRPRGFIDPAQCGAAPVHTTMVPIETGGSMVDVILDPKRWESAEPDA